MDYKKHIISQLPVGTIANGMKFFDDGWKDKRSWKRKMLREYGSRVKGNSDLLWDRILIGKGIKPNEEQDHPRNIPQKIKEIVYKRDNGKCVVCGSKKDLQYDHVIPYSMGGTSKHENNIQLLCAKCNSKKGASFKY